MRYVKNTANGRVLAWTKILSQKDGCFESDKNGNVLVENIGVTNDNLIAALDDKASECVALKKQIATLETTIAKYEAEHGPVEDIVKRKVLDAKEMADMAEAKAEVKEAESIEEIAEVVEDEVNEAMKEAVISSITKTKKQIIENLEDRSVDFSVNDSKTKLAEQLDELILAEKGLE